MKMSLRAQFRPTQSFLGKKRKQYSSSGCLHTGAMYQAESSSGSLCENTVNRGGNINDCFFKTWLCTDGKRRKTKPEFWSCAAGPTLFLPVWGPRTHTLARTLTHRHRFQRKPPFTMGLNQTAILQLHLRGGEGLREGGGGQ